MLVVAGNAPTAKLRECLAAKARPAGAEEDERAGAVAQFLQGGAGGLDVLAPFGNAQERERPFGVGLSQGGEPRLKRLEVLVERGLREAKRADGRLEAAFNRLR